MKKHSTYYLPYKTKYKPQTTQQRDTKLHVVIKKAYDPLLYSKNSKIKKYKPVYQPYKPSVNPINSSENEFRLKEKEVMSYSPNAKITRNGKVKSYNFVRNKFNYNFLSKFVTQVVKTILKWISNLNLLQLWK